MKKKMMKALKELNAYIDDDRQKLCDRLHDLELSHKRMERMLKRSKQLFDAIMCHMNLSEPVFIDVSDLVICIERELSYPYFRVNYKQKGGKNA